MDWTATTARGRWAGLLKRCATASIAVAGKDEDKPGYVSCPPALPVFLAAWGLGGKGVRRGEGEGGGGRQLQITDRKSWGC